MSHNLTIGDVLPSSMKSNYSDAVLNTSLDEAVKIAEDDQPSSSGLSEADISAINGIYSHYLKDAGSANTDSAYWNKSKADNQAYWDKGGN